MFHLNKDVLILVLTNWFGIKDVGMLDSAVCNCSQRKTFLQLLKDDETYFSGVEDSVRVGHKYIHWINIRSLFVLRLNLYDWLSIKATFSVGFTALHRLKHLKIENYSFVEALPLIDTAMQCHDLETLEVFGSKNIVDSLVEAFMPHCHKLSVVTINTVSHYTDVRAELGYFKKNNSASTTLTRSGLISILKYGANVTKLDASNHSHLKLGGSDAKSLSGGVGCPKLTHLNLYNSCCLNDESVALILQNSSALTHVDLKGCRDVTDRTLYLLAQQCPGLLHLSVSSDRITDIGLRVLSVACRRLEHVDLNGCTALTDKGVAGLVEACVNLKHISLKRIAVIGDATLRALCEHCPLLEFFAVGRTRYAVQTEAAVRSRVTDTMLSRLAAKCPRLHTLKLTDCCELTTAIDTISKCCPLFRKLTLTGGSNVTEAALLSLSQRCPLFEYLDAERCNNITDRLVISLAEHCHHMIYLNVSYAAQVTDVGVRAVAKNCPQLQSFTVNSCRAVTISALVEVSEACPRLVKIMCFGVKHSILLLQSVLVNNPFMLEMGVSVDSSVHINTYMQQARQVNMTFPRMTIAQVMDN